MIPHYTKNPVLRERAEEVPVSAIAGASVQKVIREMKQALAKESDGVAIAAPQIGQPLRIFVVAGKIFDPVWAEGGEAAAKLAKTEDDLVFINPKITKRSKKTKMLAEGCLSVRWLYGKVKRHANVTIEAYDERGTKTSRGAGGLLAQIFQHEIDHLDGILFIDKAEGLEEVPPPEK